MAAEKLARLGIKREPGFLYFLRGTDVWRTRMKRAGDPAHAPEAELVARGDFRRAAGFLYFVDAEGDICRAARADGPPPAPVVEGTPFDLTLAEAVLRVRRADGTEPLTLYIDLADRLEAKGQAARAEFIRRQCAGEDAPRLFDQHRASWGIPDFAEGLIVAGDFRRGFLHTFRDHSAAWSHHLHARQWFLTSPEARFCVRYQMRHADNGFEECGQEAIAPYPDLVELMKTNQEA